MTATKWKESSTGGYDMKEHIGTSRQWYAIRTRYKCEKRIAEDLNRRGIECYVPLISKTRRYTRKIKQYEVPLINTYAFVRISRDEYVRVLDHQYVMDYVRFGREVVAIPEDEITTLRRVCGEFEDTITAEEIDYSPGDAVELIYGRLSGLRGHLEERHGKHEFVVRLDHIGYQLRIVAERHMLMRVPATA